PTRDGPPALAGRAATGAPGAAERGGECMEDGVDDDARLPPVLDRGVHVGPDAPLLHRRAAFVADAADLEPVVRDLAASAGLGHARRRSARQPHEAGALHPSLVRTDP